MSIDQRLPNLPAYVVSHTLDTLRAALPPPVPDTSKNRAAMEELAVAALVALQPSDAFEAMLATQIVLQEAHAADCLRLAAEHGADPVIARRNRAMAGTMMKLMRSGLRTLRSRQAGRHGAQGTQTPRVVHALDLRVIETPPTRH